MSRGKPNKRYTPEFKKLVVETMIEERLSYCETARRFEVRSDTQVRNWERIYLSEGPEALAVNVNEFLYQGGCGRKVGPLQGGKQMYSYEERLRAVKLYIKCDHSLSAVIRELGYPSHQALLQWYREYITQGDLHTKCVRHRRRCKYTMV